MKCHIKNWWSFYMLLIFTIPLSHYLHQWNVMNRGYETGFDGAYLVPVLVAITWLTLKEVKVNGSNLFNSSKDSK